MITETIQWREPTEEPISGYILVRFNSGVVQQVNYNDGLICTGNYGWVGGCDHYSFLNEVEMWAELPTGDL